MARARSVERLMECLAELPGVGPKTAERFAYHLLGIEQRRALELAKAIETAVRSTRVCSQCFNLDESDPCSVCSDAGRDRTMLLVVEAPRDIGAFEAAGYRGLYHVLQGRVSNAEGIGLEQLTVEALCSRAQQLGVAEICLATNPDLEGEATSRMVAELLGKVAARITRLARGLPAGASIAQASSSMLADAVEGRRTLRER
jgi:recombination protein RecR